MKRAMRFGLVGALVLISGMFSQARADADAVLGLWRTTKDAALVSVARCGDSVCGTILELKREADGKTILVDSRNKDAALRTRRIKGLMILSGYHQQGDAWVGGMVYSPERGRAFRSRLAVQANGQLKVEGCLAQICQAEYWTRAPASAPGASP